jgi:hypothetical protein
MLSALDSQALSEWAAWELVNGPLGAERGDWQAATIAANATAIAGGKGKLSRYMLWQREPEKGATTPEDQLNLLRAMFPPSKSEG